MDDLVAVDVVKTEAEAELICSLLRTAGITSIHRPANQGAGAFDGATFGGGPREVVVNAGDLDAAREILQTQRSGN